MERTQLVLQKRSMETCKYSKIDDEFIIIFGDDTEGHQTYAEKITRKQAKKMIMEYKPELFEENEFKEL